MKERGILFSAPMVRAILNGRKTQTRRTLRPQPPAGWFGESPDEVREPGDGVTPGWLIERCPHGTPGDRLWVKETVRWTATRRAVYVADGSPSVITEWPWQRAVLPSIFLPRGASRITLEITEVRVQRLQEISEDDARAEGVDPYTPPHGHISPEQRVPGPGFDRCRLGDQPHRLPFADLWDSINGKRAPWSSNPWVWAITFRRVER